MPSPCSIATYRRWYHHRAQKLSVARNPDAQKTPDGGRDTGEVGRCSPAVITKLPKTNGTDLPKYSRQKRYKLQKPTKQTNSLTPSPPRSSWQKFPDRRPLWRWIRDAYRAKLPQVATGKVATGNTTAPCKLATSKMAIFKSSRSWTFLIKSLICNCLMTW